MVQHNPVRPPVLVATRASVTFLMQSVRATTRHVDGDILGGITVLALLQDFCTQQAQRGSAVNGSARPVSVQSLARSLKTPRETMRRCVARLIALGWCRRVAPHGVVLSDSATAGAKIDLFMAEIRAAFYAMLVDLKQI